MFDFPEHVYRISKIVREEDGIEETGSILNQPVKIFRNARLFVVIEANGKMKSGSSWDHQSPTDGFDD
jgi:hypothetical protein